jgi:hypothetical protein
VHSKRAPTGNRKKYNRFATENARQLQCKALRELEKSRRRKNNCKQWKKQFTEQSKTVGNQGLQPRPNKKPAEPQWRAMFAQIPD